MTDELSRLEIITREHLDAIDDSDLVAAGHMARETARRWAAVDRALEQEQIIRAESAGAKLIIGGDVDAKIVQKPGQYVYDMDAMARIVRPVLGERVWHEVVTEVPHVCPPPQFKADSTKLAKYLRDIGKGELLDSVRSRPMGLPKVEYEERGE